MNPRQPPASTHTYTTELEAQLGRDENGSVRAALRTRLLALQDSLTSQLRRPHPVDRYRQLDAALRATQAALETLRCVHVPRPDGSFAGPPSHLAFRRD